MSPGSNGLLSADGSRSVQDHPDYVPTDSSRPRPNGVIWKATSSEMVPAPSGLSSYWGSTISKEVRTLMIMRPMAPCSSILAPVISGAVHVSPVSWINRSAKGSKGTPVPTGSNSRWASVISLKWGGEVLSKANVGESSDPVGLSPPGHEHDPHLGARGSLQEHRAARCELPSLGRTALQQPAHVGYGMQEDERPHIVQYHM